MYNLPKTKIYATIGPSSWDDKVLIDMINNGMQVARINASFADAKEIERVTTQIRRLSPRTTILLDTMGHKIRVTGFEKDRILTVNDKVILVSEQTKIKAKNVIKITYPTLEKDVTRGTKILFDDGNLVVVVDDIKGKAVHCSVLVGGILKKRKTVNIPGVHLNFPNLPEKDQEDIAAGIANNVDLIAASFVRNVEDVKTFRKAMGNADTKLIAKIEDAEGIQNFDEILELVDGIMIARGDLGVEEPMEKIPIYQKVFIQKCRERGKFSIVATQMLESMRDNPRPTRAETTDVANAVMDGADAVMLSAETSTGKYPVEAVKTMAAIAKEVEAVLLPQPVRGRTDACEVTDILNQHIPQLVNEMGLKGVVVVTRTGKSVASLARHRLNVPIWVLSTNPKLIRQLQTYRGVIGFYVNDLPADRNKLLAKAVDVVYGTGYLDLNDRIAVMSGSSVHENKYNSILEVVDVTPLTYNTLGIS